jgi:uncharacterized Zn finger protein (UPF0148 family)
MENVLQFPTLVNLIRECECGSIEFRIFSNGDVECWTCDKLQSTKATKEVQKDD